MHSQVEFQSQAKVEDQMNEPLQFPDLNDDELLYDRLDRTIRAKGPKS